jgi:drug/metabolite transporter superfamily protein YnfA
MCASGSLVNAHTGFHRYSETMGRVIVMIVGVVVALFGVLFALQGFGVVGGSPMSNTTTWSVLGPIIALAGFAIAVAAARRRK